jgi:hypothetical protein
VKRYRRNFPAYRRKAITLHLKLLQRLSWDDTDRPPLSSKRVAVWSQPVDATLYLRRKWNRDVFLYNSYIANLIERHTRYAMLPKVAHKDTHTVISALIKQAKKLPARFYRWYDRLQSGGDKAGRLNVWRPGCDLITQAAHQASARGPICIPRYIEVVIRKRGS